MGITLQAIVQCDHLECRQSCICEPDITAHIDRNDYGDEYASTSVSAYGLPAGWAFKSFGGNLVPSSKGYFCPEHAGLYPRPLGFKVF